MASPEPPSYVFDSFALLAQINDEPGADQVESLLELARKKQVVLWLSIVNLAEVLYVIERKHGLDKTAETLATIDELPLQTVDVQRARAFSAAHIKAQHAISFADAFAVALAKEKNARVVTGDPEFEKVAKEIAVEWLPRKASSPQVKD
ncbi:MAG: type II toxin-antitoxin system VapC family toxin [Chloroflexi bacterium]|nr:type II toxin-antitoxin system VapC family toxin [Chloroflexota bacterium]